MIVGSFSLPRPVRQGKLSDGSYAGLDFVDSQVYDGNRVTRIHDPGPEQPVYDIMEFKNGCTGNIEYEYDTNGNLTKDLNKKISLIRYNYINLPERIEFESGDWIQYQYSASGVKLQTKHYTVSGNVTATRDYIGNKIYENGVLKTILTEEGYIEKTGDAFNYFYYLQDHLGNNRVVLNSSGAAVQVNNYYPFGLSMWEGVTNESNQPYKYNGKELDRMHGLNLYDYGARMHDPAIGRFSTPDPLAEKYYNISPYAYCNNNPVNLIDLNGMDWYTDKDGSYQYDPNVKSQEDLENGQTYVGVTHQVKNDDGNVIEEYRKDGSIMFSDEASGYKRVWNNSEKTGNEEMAVITKEGVLVLPSWGNGPYVSLSEDYGYAWKNGNLIDAITGKSMSILGTFHTHPVLSTHEDEIKHNWMGPSGGDFSFFGKRTPGIPFFVITADTRIHSVYPISVTQAKKLELNVVNGILPTLGGLIFGGYPLQSELKKIKK